MAKQHASSMCYVHMRKQGKPNLQGEMDYWVKDFEKKISRTEEMGRELSEARQNTDFNYELIKSMQKDIEELKRDVTKLKHYMYIAVRSRPLQEMGG